MNLNWNYFYLVIFSIAVIAIDSSQANKHDKKHNRNKPNSQQAHKNSTISHGHRNHTSSHANVTTVNQNTMFINNEQQHVPQNPSNIGWSLDKNQAPSHHNNPNGYVMQPHDNSHGPMNVHHNQNMNVPIQQQQQGGSNLGGIALGVAGGAVGGKFN